ncbi:MAG: amidohydrolase family protein [Mycobacteriaceae bacterium]|nr:amidohydrolase family protein [Mycobacteriaceae bacterium]
MTETHLRGRIVTTTGELPDGVVTVAGARIASVLPYSEWGVAHPTAEPPEPCPILLPGMVDIHNHGGGGHSFATTDPAEAGQAAAHHHAHGTTTLVASLVTAEPDTMLAQVRALRTLVEHHVIAGIHCEGPFLAATRCGAHNPRLLREPDPAYARLLIDAAGGALRMVTMAPELPGFADTAAALRAAGVRVALGHSAADYADFAAALHPLGPAGVVTHLANGMPPLHHRAPGPVAAALLAASRGDVTIELIADGVHLDTRFAAMVFAAAPRSVALVTDAMAAAGMGDGTYRLGPETVVVCDGVARTGTGSLAGGTGHQIDLVAKMWRDGGVPLVDAVRAATATPAAALGLTDVGELRAGRYADLIVTDHRLHPIRVLRRGVWLT